MAISVVSVGADNTVAVPASGATSVALQDKLIRCTRQLGDWEACASSKTPEGKKIIQNLRAQIGNLEARIGAQAAQRSGAVQPGATPASPPGASTLTTLGTWVNTFA